MDASKNAYDASVKLHILSSPDLSDAVLAGRAGNRLLFTAENAVPPGALVETEVSTSTILGEVIACVPNGCKFEIWVEISHSLAVQWRPHPTWTGVPDSVLDCLSTLNRRLSYVSTICPESGAQVARAGKASKREAAVHDFTLAKLTAALSKTSSTLRRIVSRRVAS